MTARDAILYDTATALRRAGNVADDLREATSAPEEGAGCPGEEADPESGGELSTLLVTAFADICKVLSGLRSTLTTLETTSVPQIRSTNDKLQEVSSATEVAATDILDGLDRALGCVDALDLMGEGGPDEARRVRETLRAELYSAMDHLQFQDITAQQLAYASSMLVEMEVRLTGLADAFAERAGTLDLRGVAEGATPVFDPLATTSEAGERQALADELFSPPPPPNGDNSAQSRDAERHGP